MSAPLELRPCHGLGEEPGWLMPALRGLPGVKGRGWNQWNPEKMKNAVVIVVQSNSQFNSEFNTELNSI